MSDSADFSQAFVLGLQKVCLSKNEKEAAIGQFTRLVASVVHRWRDLEIQRGVDPQIVTEIECTGFGIIANAEFRVLLDKEVQTEASISSINMFLKYALHNIKNAETENIAEEPANSQAVGLSVE